MIIDMEHHFSTEEQLRKRGGGKPFFDEMERAIKDRPSSGGQQ